MNDLNEQVYAEKMRPFEDQMAECIAREIRLVLKTDGKSITPLIFENGYYKEVSNEFLVARISRFLTEAMETALQIDGSDALVQNNTNEEDPAARCEFLFLDTLLSVPRSQLRDYLKNLGQNTRLHLEVRNALYRNSSLIKRPEDLNWNPERIVVNNGVIDLRTGELLDFDPDLLATEHVAIDYPDTDQGMEIFGKFRRIISAACHDERLNGEENNAYVEAVLRILGYLALVPGNPAKNIFIIHGPTNTGKSTIFEILGRILGSFSATVDASALIKTSRSHNDIRPEIVGARFARLILAVEAAEEMVFDSRLLKNLSGNDMMTLRRPHKSSETFKLMGKICLATNEIPAFSDTDGAFVKRLVFLHFANTVPDDKIDRNMVDKLTTPEAKSVLFAKLVEYAKVYFDTQDLNFHPSMTKSKEKIVLSQSDLTTRFFREKVVPRPNAELAFFQKKWSSAYLYHIFACWCREELGIEPPSGRIFYMKFREITEFVPAITFHRVGQRNHYTGFELEGCEPDQTYVKDVVDLALQEKTTDGWYLNLDADQILLLFLILHFQAATRSVN